VSTLELPGPPPTAVARASAPSDVVFTFSYVTWAAAAGRGWFMPDDRLARTLVGHERVRRIVVCNQLRSLPVKLVRDRGRPGGAGFPASERACLVEPVRLLRRRDPTGLRALRRTFAGYGRLARRAAERMGLEDPVVITAHPMVAGFADFSWARAVTFYATDDWAAHWYFRRYWDAYAVAYRSMRERGLRVCAVSDAVLERIAPTGPSAVVPNGLEPAEWESPRPPAWLERDGRPLLVYVGTLDSRLDVDALRRVSAELPEARVLLVGPIDEPRHVEPLRSLPNVELHPPVPRDEVTGLVCAADVGLIPHVRSPLTTAMSPLKLYEYLAAGLPVAAADLAPVRGIDPRVALASGASEFPAAVRTALALGRAREPERRAFVAANSWRARHDRLLDLALG
jgi:teichuronic acid biosynthesis glycosyltransferase TuaH